MKKILLTITLIFVLIASVFVLTGCNKITSDSRNSAKVEKTQEISYDYSRYKVKLHVPVKESDDGTEIPTYKFTEEVPETVNKLLYGSTFLVGDKVVANIQSSSYTYHTGVAYKEAHGDVTPSFESFKEFIFEENSTSTLKNGEIIKIGDREAIKAEYRQGSGNGDLYGYKYVINVDDITPNSYITLNFVTADGNSESTESVFADEQVQAIINSIVIESIN